MNGESNDLLRTIAGMEFDPLPVADAVLLGELVNSGKLADRLHWTGLVMRLSAYLITRQKSELVEAMNELALDAISATDQMRIQSEWLRCVANIIDAAAARMTTAAATFAVENDPETAGQPVPQFPANDDGGGSAA